MGRLVEKIIGSYPEARHVLNVCPLCDKREMWRMSYIYSDEGKRKCANCQNKERAEQREKEEREEYLMQLADDINELRERGLIT